MSAGVVAALRAEARTVGSPLRRDISPSTLADGTLIVVSGMGGAAAAVAARALLDAGATALVSWGMAGGLDPALRAGTLCLPTAVISSDGASFDTDHHWRELVGAAIVARRTVVHGALLTSDRPLHDRAGKARAYRDTGALAVDMESAGVAGVAAAHRIPFIAVRVIVDTADDVLPGAVLAASTGGQVNGLKLAQGLLRAPADLWPLLRLAQRYRAAVRALVAVARSGALAPVAFATAAGNRIA